jgi:hypothetical protein
MISLSLGAPCYGSGGYCAGLRFWVDDQTDLSRGFRVLLVR